MPYPYGKPRNCNFAFNALLNNGLTLITRKLFGRYAAIKYRIESAAAAFVARFTLFFGGGFFTAAVKARRGIIGNTFVKSLKGCKRKKVRWICGI
ncbi:hypothetical protein GGTG_08650 [Gaeumannomyces tritici R3-111a-1]|uniref:Uncharacterized protein n=1 Tax=Gaeumannomyces tritici (strain R3-111a-1) TaxID=644352 RepID=J3P561_GAET3|nr:hypothetical protein GGTG_08650 [Gaeumannomyces tritici R3-111a-1]EJT74812.1 hypothetical protein GGTG_08650 [Gaeumannomyces tritici R3-111a-1]